MDREALAVWIGLASGVAYLALAVLPYLVATASETRVYYGVGPVGPLALLVPAGVTLIALLSGARRRSDPATMAGVALVFSLLVALLSIAWALPAGDVVGGMASVSAAFDYHRRLVILAGAALAGATALEAAAVLR
jgi:hypothetical protein